MTISRTLRAWVHFIRKHVSDPAVRGTDRTDTFVATAGQTLFTLTQAKVNHITSVVINSSAKKYGSDYTFDLGNASTAGTITLTTGATISDSVVITYHYNGTWVYPDFPKKTATMPRISIMDITHVGEPVGMGCYGSSSGMSDRETFKIEIGIWLKAKDESGGLVDGVRYYSTELRDKLTDKILDEITKHKGPDTWDFYPLERVTGRIVTRSIPYEEEFDILRRVIEVECTIVRGVI